LRDCSLKKTDATYLIVATKKICCGAKSLKGQTEAHRVNFWVFSDQ
jgi:hypothetical protein